MSSENALMRVTEDFHKIVLRPPQIVEEDIDGSVTSLTDYVDTLRRFRESVAPDSALKRFFSSGHRDLVEQIDEKINEQVLALLDLYNAIKLRAAQRKEEDKAIAAKKVEDRIRLEIVTSRMDERGQQIRTGMQDLHRRKKVTLEDFKNDLIDEASKDAALDDIANDRTLLMDIANQQNEDLRDLVKLGSIFNKAEVNNQKSGLVEAPNQRR